MPLLLLVLLGAAAGMGAAYIAQKFRHQPTTLRDLALAGGIGGSLGPMVVGMLMASVAAETGAAALGTLAGESIPTAAYGTSAAVGAMGGTIAMSPHAPTSDFVPAPHENIVEAHGTVSFVGGTPYLSLLGGRIVNIGPLYIAPSEIGPCIALDGPFEKRLRELQGLEADMRGGLVKDGTGAVRLLVDFVAADDESKPPAAPSKTEGVCGVFDQITEQH